MSPTFPHARLEIIGRALEEAGDHDGALIQYEKFIKENDGSPHLSIQQSVNWALEQKIGCLIELNQSGRMNRAIMQLYDDLILRWFRLGNKKEAARSSLDKADFMFNNKAGQPYAEYQKIVDNFKLNSDKSVLDYACKAALKIFEYTEKEHSDVEHVCVQLAEISLKLDDDETVNICQEAADLLKDAELYLPSLQIYTDLGNQRHHDKHVYANCLVNKGICLGCLGEHEDAIRALTDVLISADEDDFCNWCDALMRIGYNFEQIGKHDHAVCYYREMVRKFERHDNQREYSAEGRIFIARLYANELAEKHNDPLEKAHCIDVALKEYANLIDEYQEDEKASIKDIVICAREESKAIMRGSESER